METFVLALLFTYAPSYDIDPFLAAAVVKTESRFNPRAIGSVGEVGLFQIRPEFSRFTKDQLLDPYINVIAGLEMLQNSKRKCKYQQRKLFVICHNLGIAGARKIKYPHKFPYYTKVYGKYEGYLKKAKLAYVRH